MSTPRMHGKKWQLMVSSHKSIGRKPARWSMLPVETGAV